jgi:phage tail-like protein
MAMTSTSTTAEPTFWLLNGRLGWRTGHSEGVAVGAGLRLAADPAGPLALTSADGSLGGLLLPVGMALDHRSRLYLLDTQLPGVRCYAPDPPPELPRQWFPPLPGIGGEGHEARQLRAPANIAIAGNDLYIADRGNHRVQVFALDTLALRYVWGPWDDHDHALQGDAAQTWDPCDVAAQGGTVVILDGAHGRVYRHRVGYDALSVVIADAGAAGRWSRVALDTAGRIYLLDTRVPRLEIYAADGVYLGVAHDAGDVLERFAPPPVRLDHRGRFCLPAELAGACDRRVPATGVPRATPLVHCATAAGGRLYDRHGVEQPPDADAVSPGPPSYRRTGVWVSTALDSQRYACQWHRIELALADLPVGSKVRVSTYTDPDVRTMADILALPAHLWDTRHAVLGDMQAAPSAAPRARYADTLVLSHEGQYLWLRLEVMSDGYSTPTVQALRAHYPRQSYLQYLPPVYAADDDSRRFLERFLSIFQTDWDRMEREIEWIARYFDPDAVPEGAFLAYLAEWLALPLEGAWSEAQKRRLLTAAPAIYPKRGTPQALMTYLRIYLSNLTGIAPAALGDFPRLVEGFRKRNYRLLAARPAAALNTQDVPLWSPSMVGRVQLEVYAREGEARLVSTGDPDRDVFHEHAHRFEVFLPSAWVRTRDDEDMLVRALDAEKPAHTEYTLCLVEPRLRVGVQSTVGLDTIIGDVPVATLTCADDATLPVRRPPRNRLGYDTVLAGGTPVTGGIPLGPGTRMGMRTWLS